LEEIWRTAFWDRVSLLRESVFDPGIESGQFSQQAFRKRDLSNPLTNWGGNDGVASRTSLGIPSYGKLGDSDENGERERPQLKLAKFFSRYAGVEQAVKKLGMSSEIDR
jgi:hypothetical protein